MGEGMGRREAWKQGSGWEVMDFGGCAQGCAWGGRGGGIAAVVAQRNCSLASAGSVMT